MGLSLLLSEGPVSCAAHQQHPSGKRLYVTHQVIKSHRMCVLCVCQAPGLSAPGKRSDVLISMEVFTSMSFP